MKITKICIEINSGLLVNTYRGNRDLTNKHPNLYKWIDYRKDEEPQELPEWFVDTESTPAKWNGKELVKDE